MTGSADIAKIASDRAFSQPLVTNVYRGLIVEAIVATALGSSWKWCSEDYYSFDFLSSSEVKLEVKQSAACQSWETKAPSIARWDIAARKSVWDGDRWISQPGRNADLYVLGWHPVVERLMADHRDPQQWQFFVVRADVLGPAKTMGMGSARKLSAPVPFNDLADTVAMIAASFRKTTTSPKNPV